MLDKLRYRSVETAFAQQNHSVETLLFDKSHKAFAAYSCALEHLPPAVASLYTYLNPIIAVALGTILLGEPFHARMLGAAAVIVVGIMTVGPVSETVRGEPA